LERYQGYSINNHHILLHHSKRRLDKYKHRNYLGMLLGYHHFYNSQFYIDHI